MPEEPRTRRLHIGGVQPMQGWEIMNISPGGHVAHVGNANDLSRFDDSTFLEIYSSHTLEHLDYTGEMQSTLKEWLRVLTPGGRLMIGVPDMDTLAKLFLSEGLQLKDRFHVMRMLFGGHTDANDYHRTGLNEMFLTVFLSDAGFVNMRRVPSFGIFNDTSSAVFMGVLISLNMLAFKPETEGAQA